MKSVERLVKLKYDLKLCLSAFHDALKKKTKSRPIQLVSLCNKWNV